MVPPLPRQILPLDPDQASCSVLGFAPPKASTQVYDIHRALFTTSSLTSPPTPLNHRHLGKNGPLLLPVRRHDRHLVVVLRMRPQGMRHMSLRHKMHSAAPPRFPVHATIFFFVEIAPSPPPLDRVTENEPPSRTSHTPRLTPNTGTSRGGLSTCHAEADAYRANPTPSHTARWRRDSAQPDGRKWEYLLGIDWFLCGYGGARRCEGCLFLRHWGSGGRLQGE
jgi:hypothetical protein